MTHRPITQAVILAGGRGTRLLPLTQDRPKPMIDFHGRPFFEYLIEMLRDQGIERVLLLLGYMSDRIVEHFGDGGAFGLKIDYDITEVANDTGRRMVLAAPKVDDEFLFMYCDNYWPLDLPDLVRAWRAKGTVAQVVVYANDDGFSKDNMRVDGNGIVRVYDKSRSEPGLAGIDIGFALMPKAVLADLPQAENFSFEAALYPKLVAAGQMAAYLTYHRYYSVGSLERLPLTEAFLARRPTVLVENGEPRNFAQEAGKRVIVLDPSGAAHEAAETFAGTPAAKGDGFPYRADLRHQAQRAFDLDLTRLS